MKSDINSVAYGEEWSALWEQDYGTRPDTDDAVRTVADLAAGRPVLELGVGTGRLAVPLADLGLPVHGVDNSPWMLAGLRKKPGGERVTTTEGDLVTTTVPGRFGVVLLASYALFALTTQEQQIDCFRNAAAHLEPGGAFVVEVVSPQLLEADICRPVKISADEVVLLVSTAADRITQRLQTAHVYLRHDAPVKILPWDSRYAGPPEMDLMGRLAGLELSARWGGWDRRPYTAASAKHISVYTLPEGPV
ncbi:hypothetical protein BJF78_13485 [Pseudonocardia sp. CNS-139]|nr:hypothetical protein BJF78_13485 [Pseudonocardia sp. CNS-139]